MELWNRIKGNDVKALEIAFNKYYSPLCLYAIQIVNNEEIAQEIVSDLFLKLWEKRHYIQIIQSFRTYLYRCIHNACLDYLKSADSPERSKWFEINEQINMIIGDNEDDILNKLSFVEVEKDVNVAINQLPTQCREIFYLSRYERLTYTEIAVKQNISVNTVKTQICRALDFLRDHLKDYLDLLLITFSILIKYHG
jgi:RNA polymerase sigma-70 factor, ECF subfamily